MTLTRLTPMLHVADVERSLAFYFYLDGVESFHRALGSRGVDVGKLCVTVYRMKEFSCLDPDGHLLTFGQDTNEPPTPDEA